MPIENIEDLNRAIEILSTATKFDSDISTRRIRYANNETHSYSIVNYAIDDEVKNCIMKHYTEIIQAAKESLIQRRIKAVSDTVNSLPSEVAKDIFIKSILNNQEKKDGTR